MPSRDTQSWFPGCPITARCGGAVASYIAQFRGDADLVVAATAFLDTPSIPTWLVPAAVNLIDLLPAINQRDPGSPTR